MMNVLSGIHVLANIEGVICDASYRPEVLAMKIAYNYASIVLRKCYQRENRMDVHQQSFDMLVKRVTNGCVSTVF